MRLNQFTTNISAQLSQHPDSQSIQTLSTAARYESQQARHTKNSLKSLQKKEKTDDDDAQFKAIKMIEHDLIIDETIQRNQIQRSLIGQRERKLQQTSCQSSSGNLLKDENKQSKHQISFELNATAQNTHQKQVPGCSYPFMPKNVQLQQMSNTRRLFDPVEIPQTAVPMQKVNNFDYDQSHPST